MFTDAKYLNCDLPSVARVLEDPESFYSGLKEDAIIIFDEKNQPSYYYGRQACI